MNRKKFTRAAKIATASLVAFTMTTSPVFAATGDLWKGTTNKGSVAQMILGGSAGRLDFATSMDQYTYEVDGVGYAVGEVDTMFKANPTLSTAEVQAKVKAELTGTPVSDELVVESVSAITTTGIDVKLAIATEAVEGFTIEVKNPSGVVVPVNPINLEIGDSEVTFDFTTPLTTVALGNWTVGGVTFDTAAVAAVAAVNAASNVVELWNALQSPYFTGVVQANITAYDTALVGTEETVAEIQKIIDDVNASVVSAGEEADIVKAVADATNVLDLLNALHNPVFVRVNDAWITDYSTENVTVADTSTAGMLALATVNYFGEAKGADIEGIQAAIDAANDTKVLAAIADATDELTVAKIVTARNLVNTYTPADVEGVTKKAGYLNSLILHEAVVNVSLANTNAKLTNALTALATLDPNLDITTVNPLELTRYRDAIVATVAVTDKDSAADIQAIINAANVAAEVAAVTPVGAIAATTTTAELKTLLATLSDRSSFVAGAFDGTTVIDALLPDYRTAIVAAAAGDKDSAAEIQTIIDDANDPAAALTSIDAAATEAALFTALQAKTLNLTNVSEANKAVYFAQLADFKTAADPADVTTVADVQTVVDITNARAAFNATPTVANLTNFAIAATNTGYLDLSSAAKSEVASLVIAEKPVAGYALNANLVTEIGDQITARGTLISDVNSATTISAMNAALTAIGYSPYTALSTAQKLTVSEAFIANFPMAGDPAARVNYTTLAGIQTAIDAAIAQ